MQSNGSTRVMEGTENGNTNYEEDGETEILPNEEEEEISEDVQSDEPELTRVSE